MSGRGKIPAEVGDGGRLRSPGMKRDATTQVVFDVFDRLTDGAKPGAVGRLAGIRWIQIGPFPPTFRGDGISCCGVGCGAGDARMRKPHGHAVGAAGCKPERPRRRRGELQRSRGRGGAMTQMTQNNPFLRKRSSGSAVHRLAGPEVMRESPTAAREAWVTQAEKGKCRCS
jgi:hypothetical protein